MIVEIYPNGCAEKDGRLQPGDQILDVNGTSLKDVTYQTASQALRQTLPKVWNKFPTLVGTLKVPYQFLLQMKLTIYRPVSMEFTPIEVDLMKKLGKGLGLSVKGRKSGKGAYISDIVSRF